MNYLSNILILFTVFFLSSCQTLPKSEGRLAIEGYGFEKTLVKGGEFWITTYQKIQDKTKPYVFYIEGDGMAFSNKYKVSDNPTPRSQVFLKLVAIDKRPNVIYVARPCQYTPMEMNPKCGKSYWTSKRLSDDSVESLNEVINQVNNGQKFSLIGYSGGGGIAVLIAARNHMVKNVITVAGNLDHHSFTTFHHVTPMLGSLNPINYAKSIKNLPQLHISGEKDKIIPPFIASAYVQESASPCVKQKIYPNTTHKDGWDKIWESVYTEEIRCQ